MDKLIFFDVDNTLVCRESNKICDSTLKAIQMCKNNGIGVAIATGRSFAMLKQEGLHHLANIVVSSNGGMITVNNEVVHKDSMNHNQIKKIIELFKRKNIPYVVHMKDKSVGQIEDSWIQAFSNKYNMQFNAYESLGDEEVYQLNAKISAADSVAIRNAFPEFSFVPLIDIPDGYDIFNADCSKGSGIRYIKNLYNYKECKYYCFGDGFNDFEMFEEVDYAIAMGNGCKELKQKASYVTDHINRQGIYKALKKFNII